MGWHFHFPSAVKCMLALLLPQPSKIPVHSGNQILWCIKVFVQLSAVQEIMYCVTSKSLSNLALHLIRYKRLEGWPRMLYCAKVALLQTRQQPPVLIDLDLRGASVLSTGELFLHNGTSSANLRNAYT